MATRSPHKTKKAAKQFKKASGGVGGAGGIISAGKLLRGAGSTPAKSTAKLASDAQFGIGPTRLLSKGTAREAARVIKADNSRRIRPMLSAKRQQAAADFDKEMGRKGIDMKGKHLAEKIMAKGKK